MAQEERRRGRLPPLAEMLDAGSPARDEATARAQAGLIETTLAEFGLPAQVRNIHYGPRLTQFSLKPKAATPLAQVKQLEPDLAVALAGALVAIEGPTPDYPYIILVVENYQSAPVKLRPVLESPAFQRRKGALKLGLGLDTFGEPVGADLAALPHLLVGGMTGSGKSAGLHAAIASLLCLYPPQRLQLLLIDPLEVEFKRYNGLPHLVASVVTGRLQALEALQQTVEEIEERYRTLSKAGVRDIVAYNEWAGASGRAGLPYRVIVIDNLFDLMMDAPRDLEQAMARIAQKARGAGVHVIMATVRSNVDTVAGSIKANFPGRIAFKVANRADSQLIIDAPGAESLLGQGDMLFRAPEAGRLQRLQGVYVSEQELDRIINFWYRR